MPTLLDVCTTAYRCKPTVVTDLDISFGSEASNRSSRVPNDVKWRRIEKDLYLHMAETTAWLHIAEVVEDQLTKDDLVITDIRARDSCLGHSSEGLWESRPGDIWLLRSNYTGESHQVVTGVDVLFGADAVDPRSQWHLLQRPLQLGGMHEIPVARLSVRQGPLQPRPGTPPPELKAGRDGKFKIVQISDTHNVVGPGVCKDAIDENGQPLPPSEADPLTVKFLERVLDVERPDLVVFTGDQIHHDISDGQSALFKVVAPVIKRTIPFAAVFGNHDDEGAYAMSRSEQMTLLRSLPFSLCQSGPEQVDGIGNYYLQVFSQSHPQTPVSTIYLLDSHGQIPSKVKNPDYDWIKQTQIDWFLATSQELRKSRVEQRQQSSHMSLAFMHIPLPEYGDSDLVIRAGHRREPTEGPSFNSHFYDDLAREGVVAVGCGHDHVNDFCGQKPQEMEDHHLSQGPDAPRFGPWLCHGGCSGFGGYSSYGGKRYHRRARVWGLDTNAGRFETWTRVEYARERTDQIVLAKDGVVVTPPRQDVSGD